MGWRPVIDGISFVVMILQCFYLILLPGFCDYTRFHYCQEDASRLYVRVCYETLPTITAVVNSNGCSRFKISFVVVHCTHLFSLFLVRERFRIKRKIKALLIRLQTVFLDGQCIFSFVIAC